MNKVSPFLIVCALIFLAPAAQAKVEVVATTPDFSSIAAEIGGSRASVTTLAKPTEVARDFFAANSRDTRSLAR